MATRGKTSGRSMKHMASSTVNGNRLASCIYLLCCLGAITHFDRAAGQEPSNTQASSTNQRAAASSKALNALKAKVAAIAKSFSKSDQSEDKVTEVMAAIKAFAETYPEMLTDAVQAAITAMDATKAEVGALVAAAVQIAPGQAQAIANGASVVAPDAVAEIQAAVPGVTFGPGPLVSPGGGSEGTPGGQPGGSGTDNTTPPNVTETGFNRRR